MTVPDSPVPEPAVPVASPSAAAALPAAWAIDRSCRMPVLILLVAAAVWLGLGTLLGMIAAIKAHAPGFLAGTSWLTYGRVRPASESALLYGFVLPAGIGVGLWIICRLGRNLLEGSRILTASAVFWNVGLLIGCCSILSGSATGYEGFQLPRAVWPILFTAYVLMGSWAIINLHLRQERTLYVSQWLLLAGLLWFPWVLATAAILLLYFPVRGVMQAVVNGWFLHNFWELCLAPFALAVLFYFIPKMAGRPLYSRGLVLFGFWFLVLFGGWGGLKLGEPVPSWISSVSMVSAFFLLLPVLAFGLSWFRTFGGRRAGWASLTGPFFYVAALSYVLAAVLQALGAHPALSGLTLFTLYDQGIAQLKIHGFLSMALAGAIYEVGPRLLGGTWQTPRFIRVHFWCAAAGVTLTVIALLVGGLIQGGGINEPGINFLQVMRRTLPFLGINTLGMTLLLAGYGILIWNLGRLLAANCPCSSLWSWGKSTKEPVLLAAEGRAQP